MLTCFQKANPDAENERGYTPLLVACKCQQVHVAMQLITSDCELNPSDENNKTALMYACEQGHLEVVAELMRRGARVNITDSSGRTAKEYAVRLDRPTPENPFAFLRRVVYRYKETNLP